ncbi:putative manganese-dependent inorganic diphosphatase [Ereboglobus luteus]|uniref:inorganic diphosphatase n=1 Tax=Ereboglobus luteus TaxID=1796921 RepID=A0A2U8E136_9BACT|nr:putative manganese-dependent inorganic diphosphatase [Ereboglobus luteus]AWI08520.1 pyrophosphatase [Ereboglobus luteus]
MPQSSDNSAPATTYVIGHRNPDTDAICSAIAYAAYKKARGEHGYIPARCGNSNARIDTVLRKFGTPLPLYLSDVTPRVHDVMVRDVISLPETATCAEALELIDEHDVRVLPVTTGDQRVLGTISIFQLGGYFTPRLRAPRDMRKVETTLAHVTRALNANILHLHDPDRMEDLYVRIGAMDIRSFGKQTESGSIPINKTIIIVGDRWDIQQRSIQFGVRALIVTGNLPIDTEVVEQARAAGVSVISSPYDSATTAWVVRTAGTIESLLDRKFASVSAELPLGELRRRVASSHIPAYLVTGEDGRLQGIITKSDVIKPVQTRLVLVDHNEMNQAVPGAHEVTITEIIDHHRLGPLNTQQPILFINEPVGSTCTIIADLFRRDNLRPAPDIAGLMMSGIITDTLHLNSPTTTPKDTELLAWLSEIAGVDSRALADEIFSSGSVILANTPESVIRADLKIYEENEIQFAVSQVEELGFANFWKHAKELSLALGELIKTERLGFACLLVTDINSQNSLLLVRGDKDFISRISYPHLEKNEIFELAEIVSRKKQLLPYITSILREMQAEK